MNIKQVEKTGGVMVAPEAGQARLPAATPGTEPGVLPAFKLKKILVPLDFSECTQAALRYAVPFARQFDAELTLLHVVETAYLAAPEMGGVIEVETTADAGKKLRRLCDQFAGTVRCRAVVRQGVSGHEILATAGDEGSDLIILSTHGRTGLARLLLGSTAERVARHAGCPLLIVRPNEHEFVTAVEQEWRPEDQSRSTAVEAEMTTGI